MLDTILIGASSMQVHSKAIKMVGNNLANVNTPGFKGSQLEFAALFDQGASAGQSGGHPAGEGQGLQTVGTTIDFRVGSDQVTGDPLDAKINGNGFFVVQRGADLLFTRDGNFELDAGGRLLNGYGDVVQTADASGRLVDLTIAALEHSKPKATTTVMLSGNLNPTVASPPVNAVVDNVAVVDAQGSLQRLKLTFLNQGGGIYSVTVADAAGATLATGRVQYAAGTPMSGADSIGFSYRSADGQTQPLTLDFKGTSSIGGADTLAFNAQDGYPGGMRVAQGFDAEGYLSIRYSDGQVQRGPRLVLADFDGDTDLEDAGGSFFRARPGAVAHLGFAGTAGYGQLVAGHREGSNVDLAQEFSNLIVMQRGYQAASHVVSVANDMIQELYDMKGHR